jgi:hypothetical protein
MRFRSLAAAPNTRFRLRVNSRNSRIGRSGTKLVGGGKTSVAYTVGYMKALLERANAEFAV